MYHAIEPTHGYIWMTLDKLSVKKKKTLKEDKFIKQIVKAEIKYLFTSAYCFFSIL